MWRQFVALLVTVAALEVHARSLKSPAGEPEQLPSEVYELLAQCSDFCKNASRHCLSPPRRCGACLTDYVERDGLCFYRYNPADEVDAWEQALRLANEGIASKSSSSSSAAGRVATDNRPPNNNERQQQLEQESRDDQLPLLDESNDSPETEDDTETADDNDHVTDEVEEEREQQDEFVDDKEVRSGSPAAAAAEAREGIKTVKEQDTPASRQQQVDESSAVRQPIGKGAIEIHELPTPAAMVQLAAKERDSNNNPLSEFYTLAIVIGCAVVSIFVLVGAGLCYYRYHQNAKATSAVEYPGAFVPGSGPVGVPREQRAGSGDRKLAQSAQMYHYQHQKQQMIAAERASDELNKDEESEDEENEEGDYTVYECPGLAPTGEMEVKNPLFADDSTTVTASADSPKKD